MLIISEIFLFHCAFYWFAIFMRFYRWRNCRGRNDIKDEFSFI